MKTYRVKIEGVFLKVNLEERKSLIGIITVLIVASNTASGAVARARILMLDQLAERGIDKISDGLLRSFAFISGVWELECESDSWTTNDPGVVFYKIHLLKVPQLLIEKFYYVVKKPHLLLTF